MKAIRRVGSVVVAAGLVLGLVGPVEAATGEGAVRVNQLGYGAFDGKAAYVLSQGAVTGSRSRWSTAGASGAERARGADAGEWNAKYQHVSAGSVAAVGSGDLSGQGGRGADLAAVRGRADGDALATGQGQGRELLHRAARRRERRHRGRSGASRRT